MKLSPTLRFASSACLVIALIHVIVYAYRRAMEDVFFTDLRTPESLSCLLQTEKNVELFIMSQAFLFYTLLAAFSFILSVSGYRLTVRVDWLPRQPRWYALSVLIGILFGCLYFFVVWWSGPLPEGWRYRPLLGHPWTYAIPLRIAWAGLLPPLFEELFFRNLCYLKLKEYLSASHASLVSSLIFLAWHTQIVKDPVLIGPILLLGVLECQILEKARSLLPLMIIHSIVNVVTAMLSNYA